MDKLEIIVDLNKNYIKLESKKVALSPPFFVSISKLNDAKTWVRIQYHPESKNNGGDYSKLKVEEQKLFNGVNRMFEGTPISPINGHEGTGGILPQTTLVFPNQHYKITLMSENGSKQNSNRS